MGLQRVPQDLPTNQNQACLTSQFMDGPCYNNHKKPIRKKARAGLVSKARGPKVIRSDQISRSVVSDSATP